MRWETDKIKIVLMQGGAGGNVRRRQKHKEI